MKVFFTGSPRALRDHKKEHLAIFHAIEKLGHTNLSDLVVTADSKEFYEYDRNKILSHYNQTINNLKRADIVVVEATLHSMSMGYLVEKALSWDKPLIVLHLAGNPPFFFSGIEDEKIQILEYSLENAETVVTNALEYASGQQEVRFNFFISPTIGRYLDWISKEKKIPRSVYLRALIENEMRENKEYKD